MTGRDNDNDRSRLDENLDRLLKLGNPVPGMPEDLKSRIRSRLAEMEPVSRESKFLPGRRLVWPLAAAAVLVFFIVFWNSGSRTSIVWADVRGQIDRVHTLTLSARTRTPAATAVRVPGYYRIYYKDPGFARAEEYPPDTVPGSAGEAPRKITIVKREPDHSEGIVLYPGARRAEQFESVFFADSFQPTSQSPIDLASFNWELMKEITSDQTRRIGDRVINGIRAVGFEFEIPDRLFGRQGGQGRAQLWAAEDTGTPLLIEVEYRNPYGQITPTEFSDIRWNVPLEESLFDVAVPEGWGVSRTRTESAEYANARLAPGITLQIGPDGRAPLTETEDIIGVVRGEQITHPSSEIPRAVQITIKMRPEAMQRLRDYTRANPDKLIVVDFNRQIKVAANLKEDDPSLLYFDLSLLDLPLANLEAIYFTTTIERNGL